MCGCFSRAPMRDLAHNPGMCPDWESKWQPFGSQASAQSTVLHQPGSLFFSLEATAEFLKNPSRDVEHTHLA